MHRKVLTNLTRHQKPTFTAIRFSRIRKRFQITTLWQIQTLMLFEGRFSKLWVGALKGAKNFVSKYNINFCLLFHL